MATGDYGTYTKGGLTRTPGTPRQVVQLKFDGWIKVDEDTVIVDDAGALVPPPKTGKGSSTEAWRAYADALGDVHLADEAPRDDIIQAVAAAGHPVEPPEVTQ